MAKYKENSESVLEQFPLILIYILLGFILILFPIFIGKLTNLNESNTNGHLIKFNIYFFFIYTQLSIQ